MATKRKSVVVTTPAEWIEHAERVLSAAKKSMRAKESPVRPLEFLELPEREAVVDFMCDIELSECEVVRLNALIDKKCVSLHALALYGKANNDTNKFEPTPLSDLCLNRAKVCEFLVEAAKRPWGCCEYMYELCPIVTEMFGALGLAMLILWERTLVARTIRSDIPEQAVAGAFFEFLTGRRCSEVHSAPLYTFTVCYPCPKKGERLRECIYFEYVKGLDPPESLDEVDFDQLTRKVREFVL